MIKLGLGPRILAIYRIWMGAKPVSNLLFWQLINKKP